MVVVGGGNSGLEAAIDLSAIASEVTVLEFLDELKGDQILQYLLMHSVVGIYAAGDVSVVPYKQIVIAMSKVAKAALLALEDNIKGLQLAN